jgi:hypothetical protein
MPMSGRLLADVDLFFGWLLRFQRSRFQGDYLRLLHGLRRRGRVRGEFSRHGSNRSVVSFRQRHRSGLGIDKIMTVVLAGIEPRSDRLGRPGRPLFEGDNRLVSRFHSVIGNGQKGSKQMSFVLIENLHDIPIRG